MAQAVNASPAAQAYRISLLSAATVLAGSRPGGPATGEPASSRIARATNHAVPGCLPSDSRTGVRASRCGPRTRWCATATAIPMTNQSSLPGSHNSASGFVPVDTTTVM